MTTDAITSANTQAVMLVKNGFEDAEAIMVLDFLRRMEVKVKLISCEDSPTLHSYWGLTMQADGLFAEIKEQLFSMVIVVGGPNNTTSLEQDAAVIAFIDKHDQAGKFIGAECSAPAKVLGHNGLLRGRHYVCSSGLESTVKECEGIFVDTGVVKDSNLITCKGLGQSFDFVAALAVALGCNVDATLQQQEHIYMDMQAVAGAEPCAYEGAPSKLPH